MELVGQTISNVPVARLELVGCCLMRRRRTLIFWFSAARNIKHMLLIIKTLGSTLTFECFASANCSSAFRRTSFLAPARKEAKKQAQGKPIVSLKNPFLYWRLLDKDKGEGAHSPRPRCECGWNQEQIVLTCLTPHPSVPSELPPSPLPSAWGKAWVAKHPTLQVSSKSLPRWRGRWHGVSRDG
jgi:hypothetical protein